MGWAERTSRAAENVAAHQGRCDSAFRSLRELYDHDPQRVIRMLAKITNRRERLKVMLNLGIIDHIEEQH